MKFAQVLGLVSIDKELGIMYFINDDFRLSEDCAGYVWGGLWWKYVRYDTVWKCSTTFNKAAKIHIPKLSKLLPAGICQKHLEF